jgi:hypothetical protein
MGQGKGGLRCTRSTALQHRKARPAAANTTTGGGSSLSRQAPLSSSSWAANRTLLPSSPFSLPLRWWLTLQAWLPSNAMRVVGRMRGVACRVWLAGFAGLLLAYTSDLLGSSAGYTTHSHTHTHTHHKHTHSLSLSFFATLGRADRGGGTHVLVVVGGGGCNGAAR